MRRGEVGAWCTRVSMRSRDEWNGKVRGGDDYIGSDRIRQYRIEISNEKGVRGIPDQSNTITQFYR